MTAIWGDKQLHTQLLKLQVQLPVMLLTRMLMLCLLDSGMHGPIHTCRCCGTVQCLLSALVLLHAVLPLRTQQLLLLLLCQPTLLTKGSATRGAYPGIYRSLAASRSCRVNCLHYAH
jgi:hypothetical protein